MGPEVSSRARRALPALCRSKKEDGRRPSEFLVDTNMISLEQYCSVIRQEEECEGGAGLCLEGGG